MAAGTIPDIGKLDSRKPTRFDWSNVIIVSCSVGLWNEGHPGFVPPMNMAWVHSVESSAPTSETEGTASTNEIVNRALSPTMYVDNALAQSSSIVAGTAATGFSIADSPGFTLGTNTRGVDGKSPWRLVTTTDVGHIHTINNGGPQPVLKISSKNRHIFLESDLIRLTTTVTSTAGQYYFIVQPLLTEKDA